MNEFPERLRLSRARVRLTQQELADKVGVGLRAIASYETGEMNPRAKTLGKLANVLGVSLEYLACFEDTPKPKNDTMKEDIENLLTQNKALFAGGHISQESKDAFFTAIMKAYLICKEEAEKNWN